MSKVVIVATLDTKGPEVAYLRDRLNLLGIQTLVIDSGIIGEPVGIVPDITHDELASLNGGSLAELRALGSRGQAVSTVRKWACAVVRDLYASGTLIGGISVGGVASVIGAAAIQELPVGVPKIVVAPTASGHHEFAPYVGTKDVMVVHSIVDVLGLNPILTTVLDNVAAAMSGMLTHGHRLAPPAGDRPYVAITMLGNTTAAVGACKDRLAESGVESVVFHSNGVGGPAMEDLAAEGQFIGVIDYTTNEINDPLVGGIHAAGPDRLRRIGLLGLPEVVVPACIDFSVWAAGSVPEHMRARPSYDHNPEYTLVLATHEEKAIMGRIYAQRLNEATGPVHVVMPMLGLSIPAVPGGPFWDPEGDLIFLGELRQHLRHDIPVQQVDFHANDPRLGRLVAGIFLNLEMKIKEKL
jgi:uncharacterized protein (UPF0261 family)